MSASASWVSVYSPEAAGPTVTSPVRVMASWGFSTKACGDSSEKATGKSVLSSPGRSGCQLVLDRGRIAQHVSGADGQILGAGLAGINFRAEGEDVGVGGDAWVEAERLLLKISQGVFVAIHLRGSDVTQVRNWPPSAAKS